MSPPLQSRPRSFVHAHQGESLSASEDVGSLAVREDWHRNVRALNCLFLPSVVYINCHLAAINLRHLTLSIILFGRVFGKEKLQATAASPLLARPSKLLSRVCMLGRICIL